MNSSREGLGGKEVVDVTGDYHERFVKVKEYTRDCWEKLRRFFSRSGTEKKPQNKGVTKQNLRTG